MSRTAADAAAGGQTATAALIRARATLQAAGVADPVTDARRLLADVIGGAAGLAARLHDPLTAEQAAIFDAMVNRRAAREPVAQIIGSRAFWGRDFRVTRDVLDPRPDTETLVQAALEAPFGRVLDLGTGSGAILLSLLADCPGATGLGTDLSPAALEVARDNAAQLGLAARAGFALSDWYASVTGRFDLILSNPPYIAAAEMAGLQAELRDWEPRMALTDGGDGLSAYRAIAAGAAAHLAPGGRLMVEIGWQQGAAVAGILAEAGIEGVAVLTDLNGKDRVASGFLP